MPRQVNRVSPVAASAGESVDVIVAGNGFSMGATISFGAGVGVTSVTYRSENQLSATIEIAATAPFGPRDVEVTNPNADSGTALSAFCVVDRPEKYRKDFLIAMYSQMWKNIDTHILVVWQSVAAVLGAFALFGLVEKGFLPLDIASTLIVLLSAWLIAHVYDAWEWFHRNLIILTNIERQFLRTSDRTAIHPFFESHRKPHQMLRHLQIQFCLGLFVAASVLIYHFFTQVFPGICGSWSTLHIVRSLPYLAAVVAFILLCKLRRKVLNDNREMTAKAPGIGIV